MLQDYFSVSRREDWDAVKLLYWTLTCNQNDIFL